MVSSIDMAARLQNWTPQNQSDSAVTTLCTSMCKDSVADPVDNS